MKAVVASDADPSMVELDLTADEKSSFIEVRNTNHHEPKEMTKMLNAVKRVSAHQPEQAGLGFPEIPVFATHAGERQHRKKRPVAACRAFVQQGFDYGFAWPSHSTRPGAPPVLLDQPDGRARAGSEWIGRLFQPIDDQLARTQPVFYC